MSTASLRQYRRRIRSVENTKKITRAMEMVAAAKLRRFQDFLESSRPYTQRLEALLEGLLAGLPEGYGHPYLEKEKRGQVSDQPSRDLSPLLRCLVLFTSDTGLCGTYNSLLEEKAKAWVKNNWRNEIKLIFVGKHGAGALVKKGGKPFRLLSDLRVNRIDEIVSDLAKTLEEIYLKGEAGEVHVIYTRLESLARFQPVEERLLPISPPGDPSPRLSVSGEKSGLRMTGPEYLIEPDPKTVLDRLIPAAFAARVRFIFYHALLTEQIARMNAMRQATKNAKDMIDRLTLLRNKARQAAITKEIIEVVSGSRALKLK